MNPRHARDVLLDQLGRINLAREIIRTEADALRTLVDQVDEPFSRAVEILLSRRGSAIVTGMGKAGLVGQKIAATLASTGTPSHFVHPSEALHGDLGRIQRDDCVLVLSNSGETAEVVQLVPTLLEFAVPVIAVTSRPESRLGQLATVVLDLGVDEEACPLGLAPSASTTAMLALGDALALVASNSRGFTHADFARFHPGGSLGRKLAKVREVMRPLEQCCVAPDASTLREIYVQSHRPRRRSGAILLVDAKHRLSGIFTDSDLARLFENNRDAAIDRPIREVMTATPITIRHDAPLVDAIHILAARKISELPVVDASGHPAGLIDITDVVSLLPARPRDKEQAGPEQTSVSPAGSRTDSSSRAA
jgi:arabinose-5-phosphate isomerase